MGERRPGANGWGDERGVRWEALRGRRDRLGGKMASDGGLGPGGELGRESGLRDGAGERGTAGGGRRRK